MSRIPKIIVIALVSIAISTAAVFSFIAIIAWHVQNEEQSALIAMSEQFPVTVDPKNKLIVENTSVNTFLDNANASPQAAVLNAVDAFWSVSEWIASSITEAPLYQFIASAVGADSRVVTIKAGMRKEQVANAFAKTLAWNTKQTKIFTTATASSILPLAEGSFSPGTYLVKKGTTPIEAQDLVNERFSDEILDHYGTSTAEVVPLDQALTIASLIEREAGSDDMRLISGIIWNRLFADMKLQIDATVQYAKANSKSVTAWWPKVLPADTSRKSPYNTYQNAGLPPTPIANPSVAAVLAALNPKQTDCMFYFHDNAGQFHCTNTYKEHVTLLKKYFGRGK